jgi:hypothetical protein
VAQGPLDHPSYLTRQSLVFGKTTAGANTVQFGAATGGNIVFPYDVRLRNMVGSVSVAGTSASPGSSIVVFCPGTSVQFPGSVLTNNIGTSVAVNGSSAAALTTNTTTTTLGFLPTGTATASSIVQSGDMNVRIPAGQSIVIKNGTDATVVVGSVAIEYYIDPASASWTGNN